MKDAKFEELRDGIHVAFWHANQCLENYKELDCAIHSGKTGINQFYHFFLFAEWAFYRCFINNIYNAIHKDKENKTHNLHRLHNYVQSHPELSKIFKEHLPKLLELIQDGKYEYTIEKIKSERDKVVSHNDLIQYGFYPSVSYAEAKQFIDALIDIFDDISIQYNGTGLTFDLPFLHADALLQYLDKGYSENQPRLNSI